MKRADVKVGTEYAVRRGSYGKAARVLIVGEMEVEQTGQWGYKRKVRGMRGRLIEGFMPRNFEVPQSAQIEKVGDEGFVRPRDISHEWTVEVARRENNARIKAERAAEKQADEDERRVLIAKAKALGIDLGLRIMVDDNRYSERAERVPVRREALAALIEKAGSA